MGIEKQSHEIFLLSAHFLSMLFSVVFSTVSNIIRRDEDLNFETIHQQKVKVKHANYKKHMFNVSSKRCTRRLGSMVLWSLNVFALVLRRMRQKKVEPLFVFSLELPAASTACDQVLRGKVSKKKRKKIYAYMCVSDVYSAQSSGDIV